MPQLPADGSYRPALDGLVARHGRLAQRLGINPDVVIAPVVVKDAPAVSEVALEGAAIHALRLDFDAADCRSSFARDPRKARSASRAFAKHSAIVSPSVINSG